MSLERIYLNQIQYIVYSARHIYLDIIFSYTELLQSNYLLKIIRKFLWF